MYMYGNIVSPYYRPAWWMFTKLSYDDKSWPSTCVKAYRPDQPRGGSTARQRISHCSTFSKQNKFYRRAAATNMMHSNDLEAC